MVNAGTGTACVTGGTDVESGNGCGLVRQGLVVVVLW